MAEEKKPPKAPGGGQTDRKTTEQIIYLLVGLLLLGVLANALLNYIDNLDLGASGSLWSRISDYFREHIWPIWKVIAVMLSALAVLGIIHNLRKLRAINIEENKIYGTTPTSILDEGKIVEPTNEKWEKILGYTNSGNPSEWRLAIIEADVMLEETLRGAGYTGESLGEMLTSADNNVFLTLEDAWEGHKIRNEIAHAGDKFQLNERTTKTTIAYFEKVFKEFKVI